MHFRVFLALLITGSWKWCCFTSNRSRCLFIALRGNSVSIRCFQGVWAEEVTHRFREALRNDAHLRRAASIPSRPQQRGRAETVRQRQRQRQGLFLIVLLLWLPTHEWIEWMTRTHTHTHTEEDTVVLLLHVDTSCRNSVCEKPLTVTTV